MITYVISAYRDPYELPLAVLDTVIEVSEFIGCSKNHVYRLLRGEVNHIDGYVVEVVEL